MGIVERVMMKKTINRPYRKDKEQHLYEGSVGLVASEILSENDKTLQFYEALRKAKQESATEIAGGKLIYAPIVTPKEIIFEMDVSSETEMHKAINHIQNLIADSYSRPKTIFDSIYILPTQTDKRLNPDLSLSFGRELLSATLKEAIADVETKSTAIAKMQERWIEILCDLRSLNDCSIAGNDEVYPDDKPKVRSLNEIAQSPRLKRPLVRAASTGDDDREVTSQRLMKAARIVAREHREELKALVNQ